LNKDKVWIWTSTSTPADKHIPELGRFPFQELFICDRVTTSHIEILSKILPVQLGLGVQGW